MAVLDKSHPVQCQWYQTESAVTASFKLRPPEVRGDVTAEFREDYCAVYDEGELYWEAQLAYCVAPALCKLVAKGTRAELKLAKAGPGKWEEFEVTSPANADSALDLPPLASNTYVPGDMLFVDHVYHDFYDLHERIKVKVQVGGVVEGSCKVSFGETTMEVKFQTRNAKFLRMYEDHSRNTFFVWKIKLFGEIVPASSYWRVQSDCVEVFLRKSHTKRWKTLSPPHQRPQGVAQHSASLNLTNELPDSVRATGRQEGLAGSNWNDLNTTPPGRNQPHGTFTNNLSVNSPSTIGATLTQQATPTLYDVVSSHNRSMTSSTSGYSSNASDTSENGKRELERCIATSRIADIDMPYDPNDHHRPPLPYDPRDPSLASASNVVVGNNYRDHPSTDVDVSQNPSASNVSDCRRNPSSNSTTDNHHTSNLGAAATAANNADVSNSSRSEEARTVDNQCDQFSKPSFTGLVNIGNSCFMNSVVQCLSNTELLRNYFISGQYIADINKKNPLGFEGQLATCFFDVIRNLWSGDLQYFSLRRLKSIVALRSENFGGYQQQDSHEFMSYLLDGLHEDLNCVRDKPVTSDPEGSGLPDLVLAERAWRVHRQRNDSFFVDNFQGQFKSTLVCPVCQNVSVTFDPFMSLSVPISRNLRRLPIFFVARDPHKLPQKFVLKLPPEANLELLKASVTRRTGIPMLQLRVFEIFKNKFHNLLSSNQQPITSIGEKDVIIVSEVACPRGREKVVEINMIQRVNVAPFPTKCASCGRLKDANKKLMRCSICKAVGYCDRACQGHDWVEHKMKCRRGRPTPVGLPFVISMAACELTYSCLASMAEQFARRSVEVVIQPGESVTMDTGGAEERHRAYLFMPVDRYGDNETTAEPLKDLGDTPLSFKGQYLAMDWQNDSKAVQIHPKPVLDHELDPAVSMETNPQSRPSSNAVTLDQCIELFTQPETLSKEEAWYCSKCKEHREATKQISIWKLPPILILHLKRFSFSGNCHRDKLKDRVEFPLRDLNLAPFMLGEASSLLHADAPPIYDLYATVNHYGAVFMGHYIAQVKPPPGQRGEEQKTWLLYDDDSVKTIKESEVVDSTAYLLFYRLRGK